MPKSPQKTYLIRSWNDNHPKEVKIAMLKDPARRFAQIRCDQCDAEAMAKVSDDGKMELPAGWKWDVGLCNWAPGVLLSTKHVDCDDTEMDNAEAEEVSRMVSL